MSIWCSGTEHIGTDPHDWLEPDGTPIPKVAQRGIVLSYAEGFSNHFPDETGTHERPAVVALADIAPWCVPGHDEDCGPCGRRHDYPDTGPWLRLEVEAPETLNYWAKDAEGNPAVERDGATVILDREAAKALRDDLTEWLDRPHLEAIEGAS